jgi:hypothetical protein
MQVCFKKNFARQIESPAAVARQTKAPRPDAYAVSPEKLSEKIVTERDSQITQHEHQFLVRETLSAILSHATELRFNGLGAHARSIVAAFALCR